MLEKTSALVSSNEKMNAEIELLKDQVDVLNNKVVELSEQLPEEVNRLEAKSIMIR